METKLMGIHPWRKSFLLKVLRPRARWKHIRSIRHCMWAWVSYQCPIAFCLSSLALVTEGLAWSFWYHAQLTGYLDSHSYARAISKAVRR